MVSTFQYWKAFEIPACQVGCEGKIFERSWFPRVILFAFQKPMVSICPFVNSSHLLRLWFLRPLGQRFLMKAFQLALSFHNVLIVPLNFSCFPEPAFQILGFDLILGCVTCGSVFEFARAGL